MKPVLILQNLTSDGPAYLGSWLRARGVRFAVFDQQAGQAFPADLRPYGALALLGGEMSANDALPALRQAEALVLQALAAGVPMLGHCLGGQLMARALGAEIGPSPAPEIGWQTIDVFDHPLARAWLGPPGPQTVYQWHYEAFQMPRGATLLAGSAACPHQAFAIGPHLAMQFHIELDDDKLERWSREVSPAYRDAARAHASVQDGATMRADAARHWAGQRALADRIFARWLDAAADR